MTRRPLFVVLEKLDNPSYNFLSFEVKFNWHEKEREGPSDRRSDEQINMLTTLEWDDDNRQAIAGWAVSYTQRMTQADCENDFFKIK